MKKEETLIARCKAHHISTGTYYRRLKMGFSEEEALSTYTHQNEPVTIGGVTKSRQEWQTLNHISSQCYYNRKRAGLSEEESLTKPLMMSAGRKSTPVIVKGEAKTIAEWLDFYGICSATYYNRIRKGYTREEAFSVAPTRGRPRKAPVSK